MYAVRPKRKKREHLRPLSRNRGLRIAIGVMALMLPLITVAFGQDGGTGDPSPSEAGENGIRIEFFGTSEEGYELEGITAYPLLPLELLIEVNRDMVVNDTQIELNLSVAREDEHIQNFKSSSFIIADGQTGNDTTLTWDPPDVGDYTLTLMATADGLESKTATIEIAIRNNRVLRFGPMRFPQLHPHWGGVIDHGEVTIQANTDNESWIGETDEQGNVSVSVPLDIPPGVYSMTLERDGESTLWQVDIGEDRKVNGSNIRFTGYYYFLVGPLRDIEGRQGKDGSIVNNGELTMEIEGLNSPLIGTLASYNKKFILGSEHTGGLTEGPVGSKLSESFEEKGISLPSGAILQKLDDGYWEITSQEDVSFRLSVGESGITVYEETHFFIVYTAYDFSGLQDVKATFQNPDYNGGEAMNITIPGPLNMEPVDDVRFQGSNTMLSVNASFSTIIGNSDLEHGGSKGLNLIPNDMSRRKELPMEFGLLVVLALGILIIIMAILLITEHRGENDEEEDITVKHVPFAVFECPQCTEPVPEDESTCSNCGAEFISIGYRCASCGTEFNHFSDKCPNCEKPLKAVN